MQKNVNFLCLALVAALSLSARAETPPTSPKGDEPDVSEMVFGQSTPTAVGATKTTSPAVTATPPAVSATQGESSAPASSAGTAPSPVAVVKSILPSKYFTHTFEFHDKPLVEIADEFSVSFGEAIVLNADPSMKASGAFSGTNLDAVLTILCEDLGLRFERRDNVVHLLPVASMNLPRTDIATLSQNALQPAALRPMAEVGDPVQASPAAKTLAMKSSKGKGITFGRFFSKDLNVRYESLAERRAALLAERNRLLVSGD